MTINFTFLRTNNSSVVLILFEMVLIKGDTIDMEKGLEGTTTASLIRVQSDYPFKYSKHRHSTVYPLIIFHLPRSTIDEQSMTGRVVKYMFEQTHVETSWKCLYSLFTSTSWEFTCHFFLANFWIEYTKTFIISTEFSQIFVISKLLQFSRSYFYDRFCVEKKC